MINTRLATSNDSQIIAAFNKANAFETEHKILQDDIALSGVENLMNQPQYGFYIVNEIDNEIISSLMITYEWSDWRNTLIWWIQSVYVKKEYRNNGAFKSMLHYIENLAIKHHVNCIRLYMEKDNKIAHEVYLKNNFKTEDYLIFEKGI